MKMVQDKPHLIVRQALERETAKGDDFIEDDLEEDTTSVCARGVAGAAEAAGKCK